MDTDRAVGQQGEGMRGRLRGRVGVNHDEHGWILIFEAGRGGFEQKGREEF
jgi:hypothetical protein